MTPYQKKGFPGFYMRVPLRSRGKGPVRSCCTSDSETAHAVRDLVKRLKKQRRWDLLESVSCSPPQKTLGELYDADLRNDFDTFLATADDVDLRPLLPKWEKWVFSNSDGTGTAQMYRMQVASLIEDADYPQAARDAGAGFERITHLSQLTTPKVSSWLSSRVKKGGKSVSSGYKRKLLYALFSTISYLNEQGIVSGNPIADIKRPKKGRKRVRWETEANDKLIVDASSLEYQALFAFIKATGAEVSPPLTFKPREIELWQRDRNKYCGVAHVPGTKTETRDRHDVLIEAWARPYLERHLKDVMPNALVWPGITRDSAYRRHTEACEAVGIENYTLRDARHSWAVRGRKHRKVTFEAIAAQLGNTPWQAANVYADFKPTMSERIGNASKTERNSTKRSTSGKKPQLLSLRKRG